MAYIAICNDPVSVLPAEPLVQQCSSGWLNVAYMPPFDPTQIDPVVVASLFGGGFVLYFTPWVAAWGFSILLKFIRS